jgi:hypothetical protein
VFVRHSLRKGGIEEMAEERNPHEKDGFRTSSITRFLPLKTCVAVRISNTVDIRDTKNALSPTLSFTRPEWDAFIQGVKKGEFDLV